MTTLLNEAAASDYLSIPTPTLQRWRYAGVGPAYVKLGKAVRYRIVDLEDYLANSRVDPAAGNAP